MFDLIQKFDKVISIMQGKGFGAFSVKHEVAQVLKFLKSPSLAIDIGGNIGKYSDALIHKNPKLEIHIFEPCKKNIQILTEKFLGNENIFIVPKAVSHISGSALLFSDKEGSGLASLTKRKLDHFNIDFDRKETVNAIRFEEYWCENLSDRILDLVKIDVEGHELDVLNGFGDVILKTRVVQFEFGGCNIDTKTYFRDFWYFFKSKNFSIYRITPLGVVKIKNYSEMDECFRTTNYIAINKKLIN